MSASSEVMEIRDNPQESRSILNGNGKVCAPYHLLHPVFMLLPKSICCVMRLTTLLEAMWYLYKVSQKAHVQSQMTMTSMSIRSMLHIVKRSTVNKGKEALAAS